LSCAKTPSQNDRFAFRFCSKLVRQSFHVDHPD
jgi:hypothetical protein